MANDEDLCKHLVEHNDEDMILKVSSPIMMVVITVVLVVSVEIESMQCSSICNDDGNFIRASSVTAVSSVTSARSLRFSP